MLGDIYFFPVGYTSNIPVSKYKYFPIYKKYKQVVEQPRGGQALLAPNVDNPNSNANYVLVDTRKYWYPFPQQTPRDIDYLVYNEGAEFNDQTKYYRESGTKSYLFIPEVTKYGITRETLKTSGFDDDLFAPPKALVYANNVFYATDLTFSWNSYDLGGPSKNPYLQNSVRRWKAAAQSLDFDWTPYWYHPYEKRFYPLRNEDILKILSTRTEMLTGEKWERFSGAGAKELNLANFTQRQIEELMLQGSSKEEATVVVNGNDDKATNTTGSSRKPPKTKPGKKGEPTGSTTDDGIPREANIRAIIKRSLAGAGGEGGSISGSPQMVQIYRGEDGQFKNEPDRFIFEYRPNNVSYSNIGSEWTEIDRVNNTPFVDFRNFKLMKISFEFVVGQKNNIYTSCDAELSKLRRMAMRPEPVIFLGMDNMFSEQLIYPSLTGGSGVEFAIVDMSISSVQRARIPESADASLNLSPSGEINRATVNITLQELPINNQQLVKMPKLVPDKPIPTIPPTTKDLCRRTVSQEAFQKQYGVNRKQYCGKPGDKAGT